MNDAFRLRILLVSRSKFFWQIFHQHTMPFFAAFFSTVSPFISSSSFHFLEEAFHSSFFSSFGRSCQTKSETASQKGEARKNVRRKSKNKCKITSCLALLRQRIGSSISCISWMLLCGTHTTSTGLTGKHTATTKQTSPMRSRRCKSAIKISTLDGLNWSLLQSCQASQMSF